jgi:SAM-dependent methyltransferase
MKDLQDAYGHALLDQMSGFTRSGYGEAEHSVHIPVERDDGMIDVHPAHLYFTRYEQWPPFQQRAIAEARGRVLDIGCGAGRHSLHLQDQGLSVLGIDTSPLAIDICKERGVRETLLMSISQINRSLGAFDTILMLGNNFGLLQDRQRVARLLNRLHKVTTRSSRIIAETLDPYNTDDPFHLEYHRRNRELGRMPGQVRIRVRYRKYKTPWFDYLFVSRDEMREIIEGSGWRVTRFFDSGDSLYIAMLEKEGRQ